MTHEPCKFCKEETHSEYVCDVCGTKFFGKHFHFDKFNFCTQVCSGLMREHQLQNEKEMHVEKAGIIAYYSDWSGSAF